MGTLGKLSENFLDDFLDLHKNGAGGVLKILSLCLSKIL
jgi:hypothetical protein